MTITPGNLSMLLALLSSIAPGTWAILAGILGALVGYFGKNVVKHFELKNKAAKRTATRAVKKTSATRKN